MPRRNRNAVKQRKMRGREFPEERIARNVGRGDVSYGAIDIGQVIHCEIVYSDGTGSKIRPCVVVGKSRSGALGPTVTVNPIYSRGEGLQVVTGGRRGYRSERAVEVEWDKIVTVTSEFL